MRKNDREQKETNTRKYKQQIENLKMDLIEYEEDFDTLLSNYKKAIDLLRESAKVTKGKIKYESNTLIQLSEKIYKF